MKPFRSTSKTSSVWRIYATITTNGRYTRHPKYNQIHRIMVELKRRDQHERMRKLLTYIHRVILTGGDLYALSRQVMIETGDPVAACRAFYAQDDRVNEFSGIRPLKTEAKAVFGRTGLVVSII